MAQCEFESYPFHAGSIRTTKDEQRTTSLPGDEAEEEDETSAREWNAPARSLKCWRRFPIQRIRDRMHRFIWHGFGFECQRTEANFNG